MAVVAGDLAGQAFSTSKYSPARATEDLVKQSLCLNIHDGRLVFPPLEGKLPTQQIKFLGSPTECSLLLFAHSLGHDYHELQKSFPLEYGFLLLLSPLLSSHDSSRSLSHAWDFTSDRKRMSTIVRLSPPQGYRLLCKGAPERVLALCSKILRPEGAVEKLSAKNKEQLLAQIEAFASKGLRTVAFASRDFPKV